MRKLRYFYNAATVFTVHVASTLFEVTLLKLNRVKIRLVCKFSHIDKGEKVSIILPTFNRATILFERSIPSILNQTHEDWELLVISHGCTDSTNERVEALARHDQRVKIIKMNRKKLGYPPSPENHWLVGPVKPINVGLRNVTGSWIARIDDDDEWLPEHLENSLRHAKNFNVEFISSSYKVIEKGIIKKIDPSGDPPIGGVQTWVYRSYLSFFRAHISCWRKSWNRVNDTDIAQRMRNAGVRIATHDSVGAIIKPRNESEQVGSRAYLQNPDFYSSFYDLPRPKP